MTRPEEETFAQKVARIEAEKAAAEAARKSETPRGAGGTPFEAGHGIARRFPTERLPAPMRRYVHDLATRKQVPVDLPALTMLGILGVIGGPRFIVRRDTDLVQPCNIYTCCGLDSGAGKTPVVSELRGALIWGAEQVIKEQHQEKIAERIVELRDEVEKLRTEASKITTEIKTRDVMREKALALENECQELQDNPPPWPELLIDGDITPEHLLERMATNKGVGAIVDDEGTFFRIITGLYGNGRTGNLGLLLKGYDCDAYSQGRVGNAKTNAARKVDRAALSLVLSPQPAIVASVLRDQVMSDVGFINRFIVCLPGDLVGMREDRPSTYYLDTPAERPDKTGLHWFVELLSKLVRWPLIEATYNPLASEGPTTINLDRAAWKRHVEYESQFEARIHPVTGELREIRAWSAKHVSRVLRLAALLHLAGGKHPLDQVDEQTMEDAIAIGEWTIEHYLAAGQVGGLSENAGRIKEYIDGAEDAEGRLVGFAARTDLYKHVFAKRITSDLLTAAIDELVESGDYRVHKVPTGGKPKTFVLQAGKKPPEGAGHEG